MTNLDLKGIFPATVLPMTKDYEIDEGDLRNYIRWLLEQKPKGFAVNVDTGEALQLYPEERKRIIEIYAEEVKGQVPIIAGLCANSTKNAVEEAHTAKEAGADALLVFPASAYQGGELDPEIPYRFHKAIADEVGIPIVLFRLVSSLGGIEYTIETINKLIEIDEVIAIKEATFDAVKFKELASNIKNKDITLLTGNDTFILESFVLGAEGALLGIGSCGVKQLKGIQSAVNNNNYQEAFKIAEVHQAFSNLIYSHPMRDYRTRAKEALKVMGVIKNSTVRPPLIAISEEEKERVKQGVIKAGLI